MEKVTFLPTNDLARGYYLEILYKVVTEFDKKKSRRTINDFIEMHHIVQYMNENVFLLKWTDSEKDIIRRKAKIFPAMICKYFKSIRFRQIGRLYKKTLNEYRYDFWFLMDKYECFNNIPEKYFLRYLLRYQPRLLDILSHKKLVRHFDHALRSYLIVSMETAEKLIERFAFVNHGNLYFPACLTIQDKENIIQKYIISKKASSNYTSAIESIRNCSKELEISDKTRLAAKKRSIQLNNDLFSKSQVISNKIRVLFQEQEIEVHTRNEGLNHTYSYSTSWIVNHLDFETLFK